MIVAVDFDGTLCHDAWPGVNEMSLPGIYTLKIFKQNGGRLVLWTCRTGRSLQAAIDACAAYGLTFDAINENDPQHIEMWEADHGKSVYSPKVYADLYIDDKAMMCYEGIPWLRVHHFLNGIDDSKEFLDWLFANFGTLWGLEKVFKYWKEYSGRDIKSIDQIPAQELPLAPFKLMMEEREAVK